MCKYPSQAGGLAGSASVISSSHSGSNNSSNGRHSGTGSRNTCEVPGCGRVPRKSSDSARARFCTRHGGGRPCHYPGCQVAARGLLGFCYRHRHYANSSAYGNGVDGKAMPTPTPEATESEIRAARLENYVPVPSCVDSVELAALTYIASTLKASEAATAEGNSQGGTSNTASTTVAIQDSTGSSTASPLATPASPYSATTSQSPLLSSSQEQTLVETGTSPVTTPSGGDAMEAAFAAHSSAACDIDELFSIPTIPSPIFKPVMAAASGPLDVAPCPMDTEDESAVMGRL